MIWEMLVISISDQHKWSPFTYPLVIWHLKKSCEPPYFFHWYHWFRTWFRHLLRPGAEDRYQPYRRDETWHRPMTGKVMAGSRLWHPVAIFGDVAMTIDVIYEYMCICSVCMFMYAYMYTWIRGIVCDLNYDYRSFGYNMTVKWSKYIGVLGGIQCWVMQTSEAKTWWHQIPLRFGRWHSLFFQVGACFSMKMAAVMGSGCDGHWWTIYTVYVLHVYSLYVWVWSKCKDISNGKWVDWPAMRTFNFIKHKIQSL